MRNEDTEIEEENKRKKNEEHQEQEGKRRRKEGEEMKDEEHLFGDGEEDVEMKEEEGERMLIVNRQKKIEAKKWNNAEFEDLGKLKLEGQPGLLGSMRTEKEIDGLSREFGMIIHLGRGQGDLGWNSIRKLEAGRHVVKLGIRNTYD